MEKRWALAQLVGFKVITQLLVPAEYKLGTLGYSWLNFTN